MITKEGSTKVLNFMTSGEGVIEIWCMFLIFGIDQTNGAYSNDDIRMLAMKYTDQGSTHASTCCTVTWLKYCQYGVKLSNQSINLPAACKNVLTYT